MDNSELIKMAQETQNLPMRIKKELQRLLKEPLPGIRITPSVENLRFLNVNIAGPPGTPYEGGIFRVEMFLTDEYPMSPPKVRFLTRVYHPNIDKLGRTCLDILGYRWSPALHIRSVLLTLQALLSSPNPDDPMDNHIATHWLTDPSGAIETAKSWTQKYATNNDL
mmetsp:Transcript_5172/g.7274  ORF Transcript_5172/g.7274 Transcript_5172/m.7274 type:complete len:166 (+) Transcript_5172:29-526(+)